MATYSVENKYWFAARVVAVRRKYGLTIDRRETDALEPVRAGRAVAGFAPRRAVGRIICAEAPKQQLKPSQHPR